MKKKIETFFFFRINNATAFKSSLKALAPNITTTTQVLQVSTQPNAIVNIAFSFTGLVTLGINDTLGDPLFAGGQFADAPMLNDTGTANWVPAFKGTKVHGLFTVASDSTSFVNAELFSIKALFGSSISGLYTLQGQARPGAQQGHEREYLVYIYIPKTVFDIFA